MYSVLGKEFKKTGQIWDKDESERDSIVRSVYEKLKDSYSEVTLGNPKNPLDDLIYIIISTRTTISQTQETFKLLKEIVPHWSEFWKVSDKKIEEILKPSGFSNLKKEYIQGIISKLSKDFDKVSLDPIMNKADREIYEYLISLPGVSLKVARCVMLYTMDIPVLPVDTHMHRIARRLGWTKRKRADQCHEELEALIPKKYRFIFHVGSIKHGQIICKSKKPKCQVCFLKKYCEFYSNIPK